jgi:hypothetical protein
VLLAADGRYARYWAERIHATGRRLDQEFGQEEAAQVP